MEALFSFLVLMKKAVELVEYLQKVAVAEVAAVKAWGQEYGAELWRSIRAML